MVGYRVPMVGDTSEVGIWIALFVLAASLLGILILLLIRRRKKNQEEEQTEE